MAGRTALVRLLLVFASSVCTLLPLGVLRAQDVADGMIVASATDAVSFHPFKTTDTSSSTYQRLVYASGLLERDPQDIERLVGHLAESWTVSDDHLSYTFTLRPGLVWSDGEPLTSDDFLWTYEQVRKPENGYTYSGHLAEIRSYEAPNPRTIVVRLQEPLAVGLQQADAITPLPRHVWEELDWNDPSRNPEIMAPSVVSGPFRLGEWVPRQYAVFVPNERYFKGRPRLAHYTVVVTGAENHYALLRSGRVDAASLTPSNYQLAARLDNVTVYDWWPAAGNWSYVGFNFRRPVVQDVRVRQALAYAVDRDAIIDRVLYGLARPQYSAYGPSCWCYNPDVPHRDYDPIRARELLDEAGFVLGADGMRQRDGEPLRLRLVYGPRSESRSGIATIVQDSFRQVGVELEVVGLNWEAYLSVLKTPPFAWDMNVSGWQATIDPHWMYQVWSEDNIPDLNAGAYRNPAVEALFLQGSRAFDLEARRQVYQEIQRLARRRPGSNLYLAGQVLHRGKQTHRRNPPLPARAHLEHPRVVRKIADAASGEGLHPLA